MNDSQRVVAEQAIAQLLQDAPDNFRLKVLNAIVLTGVSPKDPLFVFLVMLFPFKFSLEDAPKEIRAAIEQFLKELEKLFNLWLVKNQEIHGTVENIIRRLETAICEVETNAVQKAKGVYRNENFFRSILPPAGVIGTAVAVGIISGFGISKFFTPTLDPTGLRQLTLEQASALEWVTSSEGKLAKNIMDWNADYLKSGECQQDIQRLNQRLKHKLTLTLNNRVAKDGFCILWVEPYSRRNLQ